MEIKYKEISYIENYPKKIFKLEVCEDGRYYIGTLQFYRLSHNVCDLSPTLSYDYEGCIFSEEQVKRIMNCKDDNYFLTNEDAYNHWHRRRVYLTRKAKEQDEKNKRKQIEYHKREIDKLEKQLKGEIND